MSPLNLLLIGLVCPLIASRAAAQVTLGFDELSPGAVITDQYPFATFSSSAGNQNKTLLTSGGNVLFTGPEAGGLTGIEDTYVDFLFPVNGLTLLAVEPNGVGVVANFNVFEDGVLTAVVPLTGLGGPGSVTVDLSAYQRVTRLEIVDIDPDPAENGIAWDDFAFTHDTQVDIDFDGLPPGTLVSDQYVHAGFSSSPGNANYAVLSAGGGNVLFSGAVGGAKTGIEDTYVDFLYPVSGLTFTAVEPNGSGVVAKLRVFENGLLAGIIDLIGLGGPGSKTVDLTAFTNVTQLRITDIDPDPLENGIAWDAFSFDANTEPYVYCTAKVNSAGCTPAIAFSGIPSLTAGKGFEISATNLLDNVQSILIHSSAGARFLPFQGGTLCMGSLVWRTPVQNTGGTPPCGGTLSFDFNTHMVQKPVLFGPAQQVWAQFWSRDPGDPFGTNLTDAVSFVIGP